jgi:hypothetical protein
MATTAAKTLALATPSFHDCLLHGPSAALQLCPFGVSLFLWCFGVQVLWFLFSPTGATLLPHKTFDAIVLRKTFKM